MPDKRNQTVVFSYKPKSRAEEEIYERIGDICIWMKGANFLNLPNEVVSNVEVEMAPSEKAMYERSKANQVLPMEGGDIDAASAVGAFQTSCYRWRAVPASMNTVRCVSFMIGRWMRWGI